MRFDSETPAARHRETISVSELNALARRALESAIPLHWVAGEISNLTRAASGHVYFTLKDEQAQVRCTLWRSKAQLLPFQLAHGQKVEVRALPTLYEARGDYQLSVETVRRAGVGNLFEAFVQLRDRLEREGLFSTDDKRPLPTYPRAWGLSLHRRRRPQGRAGSHSPASATSRGDDLSGPGTGSGRRQARCARRSRPQAAGPCRMASRCCCWCAAGAVSRTCGPSMTKPRPAPSAPCPVPVISGVGHETDFTIADFVADLRAATPTAAAELATAGYHAIAQRLDQLAARLGVPWRAGSKTQRNASIAPRSISFIPVNVWFAQEIASRT